MKKILIAILIIVAGCWLACTKSDDYKKYSQGGEEVYPGAADSLKGYAGHNRVLLTFLVQADPTIVGAKVYWNTRTDSMVLLIKKTGDVDTVSVYVDSLAEASYNFEVVTFDGKGNNSVVSAITVKAYGDDFQAGLLNIPVQFSTVIAPDTGFVVWGSFDPNSGLVAARGLYTDENGMARDTTVPVLQSSPTAMFLWFQPGNSLEYRALYIPEPTAIDTFSSPSSSVTIP
jgi:hypothetical protein